MKIRNKKTGEILEDVKFIDTSLNTIEIHYLDNGVLRMETEKDYHSFLQNWEDYDEPKEPLIKDEKIRKAVRAWADGNNIESVHYDAFWTGFRRDNSSITVWEELPLEDNKVYTIAELCGEGGRMKEKDEAIYTNFKYSMEEIKANNERYENASPEYKVLHGVLNHISNAFVGIKYKEKSREDILLELAEAKGEVIALAINELNRSKGKE